MKLVNVAVTRPVTVWMFTFAIVLFGLVSLSRLSLNLLPELSYPTLTVRTDYPGAAPSEVEQLVTKPIEETIGTVKGIRKVHSVSRANQSDVVLEFEWGTTMDMASLEVREKLDVQQLPLDVKKSLILRFNPSLDPVMRYGLQLTGDGATPDALKAARTYAWETIKRQLETVSGVASVKLGGGLEQEIHVLIDPQKAGQLNISIESIANRLEQENINASGGQLDDGNREFLIRTLNQFKSLDDIRNVYIATIGSRHIKLSDIATIDDVHKERTSITRVNNDEAIEIALYKEGDANTIEVAEGVKKALKRIRKELPENYNVSLIYDQSTFIANAIDEVKSAAIIGGILAMFVLFFFLKNIAATLIISISIPVSVIATFNLMYGNDISLNIMSLGGIALAVGLLVDNSIVVLENIARHKEMGKSPTESATVGTNEVAMAITASTLTTMAVFFPLVFVQGIAGQLFSDQALTVTFALLASLIVALTLIPMLSAHTKKEKPPESDELITESHPVQKPEQIWKLPFWAIAKVFGFIFRVVFYYLPLALTIAFTWLFRGLSFVTSKLFMPLLWSFDKFYNGFAHVYHRVLELALKQRALFMTLIIAAGSSSLILLPKVGVELIPDMAQGEFVVEVNLAPGTVLEETDGVLLTLARTAAEHPDVERTSTLAGTGSLMNASASQGGDYWGKINVILKSGRGEAEQASVINALRDVVQRIPGVEAKFTSPELFNFATPLEIELSGYNLTSLRRASDAIASQLADNGRFVDIETTLQDGQPEVKVVFDHERLSHLGLTAPAVSRLIDAKVGGSIATQYSINDRKVDVLIRTQERDRDSVEDIANINVNPGGEFPVPLSSVASVTQSIGPGEITRVSQQRVAIISANLAYGDLSKAVADAQRILTNTQLPLDVDARIAGQSEEMDASFESLKFALLLAVFMVYIVMASQFESLLHPFLILFTVPLAASGSIFGLYITGTNISIIVFIGLIMLAGIVVNNAIVLVDRINQLREDGVDKITAIKEAAESRLRPIIMTTLTTTLGLLPMAIGLGEGAEIRAPMAITVIFGLGFSTLLTLLFIPMIYSVFDRKTFAKPATNAEVTHG